jgi:transposase
MHVIYPRCAGLDVHPKSVSACVRVASGRTVNLHRRDFGTTTSELLELGDWLESHGVTHVAMESTGVYWRPIWHILAERFALILGNAAHIKNVPGRKSDTKDAEWISELLAHGLIEASFVPTPEIQDLRDLTRTRRQLVHETTRHRQRIQKTLEECNIKLANVISDVCGVTGRKILRALIAGENSPYHLAKLAEGRVKATEHELVEALRGRVRSHHRFMLRLHLDQIDGLEESIRQLEVRIEELLEPFRVQRSNLITIPGLSKIGAATVIAELGVDMSRFKTAAHARSWVGVCPSLNESAGKKLSTRTRAAGIYLKPLLVQAAATVASHKKGYLAAQFRRIKARRGGKKALVAVAASILTAAYYILRDAVPYRELGPDYFDTLDKTKLTNKFVRRLKELGYVVSLQPAA